MKRASLKILIYKELRLSAHPTLYIFVSLGALVIVPNYPYGVVFLFGCLASMLTIQYGRETNDVLFSALLPTPRNEIVKGKFALACFTQLSQIVVSLPFAVLRTFLFPNGNAVGIDANIAFYGCMLIAFALYDLVFFTGYYKTAYKVGASFVRAILPVLAVVLVMETLAHVPALSFWDGVSPCELLLQLPVLAAGVVCYILCNLAAYRVSVRRFAKVDLA